MNCCLCRVKACQNRNQRFLHLKFKRYRLASFCSGVLMNRKFVHKNQPANTFLFQRKLRVQIGLGQLCVFPPQRSPCGVGAAERGMPRQQGERLACANAHDFRETLLQADRHRFQQPRKKLLPAFKSSNFACASGVTFTFDYTQNSIGFPPHNQRCCVSQLGCNQG